MVTLREKEGFVKRKVYFIDFNVIAANIFFYNFSKMQENFSRRLIFKSSFYFLPGYFYLITFSPFKTLTLMVLCLFVKRIVKTFHSRSNIQANAFPLQVHCHLLLSIKLARCMVKSYYQVGFLRMTFVSGLFRTEQYHTLL